MRIQEVQGLKENCDIFVEYMIFIFPLEEKSYFYLYFKGFNRIRSKHTDAF